MDFALRVGCTFLQGNNSYISTQSRMPSAPYVILSYAMLCVYLPHPVQSFSPFPLGLHCQLSRARKSQGMRLLGPVQGLAGCLLGPRSAPWIPLQRRCSHITLALGAQAFCILGAPASPLSFQLRQGYDREQGHFQCT